MVMIECKIEQLHYASETAWILSIPTASAADTIVRFAALYLEKINHIKFIDRHNKYSVMIERKANGFILLLDNKAFPITDTWLEAVASMLTDVAMWGWVNTSHIDADFDNAQETAAVCIRIAPPV